MAQGHRPSGAGFHPG